MKHSRWARFLQTLRELYFGFSSASRRFRLTMLTFDVVTISYFVVTTVTGTADWFPYVDVAIGVVLTLDLAARTLAMRRSLLQLRSVMFYVDLLVIIALFGSLVAQDLALARVLRLLRVLRSYRLVVDLRRDSQWFRRHEELVEAALNLTVFLFITTSLVFVIERPVNDQINTFVDALYYTIATLTTTGFGDITVSDTWGRVLTIVIMVFGVGLFLRLVQTIFRPNKVAYECPTCGLAKHDLDAVHCKHCGEVVNIPTEGAV
ncbi:potassium channel family protein [Acuticoccus sp. I52.16.1]|uniref:potassium channel family protein n=1 Tax=Acuticoccus sp. I52.16.1 TaxID=2928472 RepID=UPI001FD20481|nr:potassium channel family protein [Acuticoccus sp. I52.16.1]UOM36087.1 potassium channel family protein [Acuticoccus sp. I52.16.1]